MPVGNPGIAQLHGKKLTSISWPDSVDQRNPGWQSRPYASAASPFRFVGKNGPAPVPDGSLVEVVGLPGAERANAWTLLQATDPSRTRASTHRCRILRRFPQSLSAVLRSGLPDAGFYKRRTTRVTGVALKGLPRHQPKGDRLLSPPLPLSRRTCTK